MPTVTPDMSPTPRTLDFRDHSRRLGENVHVYAVISRRSGGLSIGINLNADKVCNFDCPYCQVDRTTSGGPRQVDLARLEAELHHLLKLIADNRLWSVPPFDTAAPHLRRVNDIAFAGDGEPTSARSFAEAVELVGRARAAFGLDNVKLMLLTNATLFHRERVARGLAAFDRLGGEIWAKLDAGTADYFRLVAGTALPFSRVLDNLEQAAQLRPLTLQCMFMTWEGAGPGDDEIFAWRDRIAHILDRGGAVREVQVYAVARSPADPRVGVLPTPRLEWIADQARALGVTVRVVPGLPPPPPSPTPETAAS